MKSGLLHDQDLRLADTKGSQEAGLTIISQSQGRADHKGDTVLRSLEVRGTVSENISVLGFHGGHQELASSLGEEVVESHTAAPDSHRGVVSATDQDADGLECYLVRDVVVLQRRQNIGQDARMTIDQVAAELSGVLLVADGLDHASVLINSALSAYVARSLVHICGGRRLAF